MAVAIKEKREVRGEMAIAMRPDGSRKAFIPYPTPLFDEDGDAHRRGQRAGGRQRGASRRAAEQAAAAAV